VPGGTQRRVFPGEPHSEEWYVGGLKINIYHQKVASVEDVIRDVIQCIDPTWANQAQVEAIRSGVVMHGMALGDSWRQQSAYPDDLARAMVAQHLVFGPQDWLEMVAERDDALYRYSLCCDVERRILGTLLGLNRTYPPAADTKWMMLVAGELPDAPDHLASRLRMVFRSEPSDGIRELGRLVEETFQLVEKHMPEVEVAAVRARVAQRRLGWPGESV
jgi:hypothetical protein